MRLRSMQELASMRLPRYIVRLEFYCLKDNFYLGSRGGDTIPSEGREAWKGRGFFFFFLLVLLQLSIQANGSIPPV